MSNFEGFNRVTGRTTRIALEALLAASAQPGIPVLIKDHAITRQAKHHLVNMLMGIIAGMPNPKDWSVFNKVTGSEFYLVFRKSRDA